MGWFGHEKKTSSNDGDNEEINAALTLMHTVCFVYFCFRKSEKDTENPPIKKEEIYEL